MLGLDKAIEHISKLALEKLGENTIIVPTYQLIFFHFLLKFDQFFCSIVLFQAFP